MDEIEAVKQLQGVQRLLTFQIIHWHYWILDTRFLAHLKNEDFAIYDCINVPLVLN